MGIGIIANFDVNTSANIDSRLGPYATLAEVTTAIPELSRYVGLTVSVTESGSPVEYWFSPGITDADLVLKNTGGTVNAAGLITTGSSTTTQAITGSLILSASNDNTIKIPSIGNTEVDSIIYSRKGFAGSITRLDYYESTYAPTVTNGINIDTLSINDAPYLPIPTPSANVEYTLIGNTVTVWGKIAIDPSTVNNDTTFEMSLPVVNDSPSAYQLSGNLTSYSTNTSCDSGTINLVVVNGTALVHIVPTSAPKPALEYWFTFIYRRAFR